MYNLLHVTIFHETLNEIRIFWWELVLTAFNAILFLQDMPCIRSISISWKRFILKYNKRKYYLRSSQILKHNRVCLIDIFHFQSREIAITKCITLIQTFLQGLECRGLLLGKFYGNLLSICVKN